MNSKMIQLKRIASNTGFTYKQLAKHMAYMLDHWHRACVSDSQAASRNRAVWALPEISDVNDTNRRAAPDPVSSFSVYHAPLRPLVVDRSVYCDKDMFLLCLRLQIIINRFSNEMRKFKSILRPDSLCVFMSQVPPK